MSGMKGNPHAASMDEYADPRNSLEAMATLALAYEQRTANLIAWIAGGHPTPEMRALIEERLGL